MQIAVDHFAEQEDPDEGDLPWDAERIARKRVWYTYDRAVREIASAASGDPVGREIDRRDHRVAHLVDELEIERWSNEALAELRAGKSAVQAIDLANRELGPHFGEEEPPIGAPARTEAIGSSPIAVGSSLRRARDDGRVSANDDGKWTVAKDAPKAAGTNGASKPNRFEEFVKAKRMAEDALRDKCVEALRKRGPLSVREIEEAIGQAKGVTKLALRRAENAGLAEVVGRANNARWQLVGGKSPAVTRKAPPASRPKAAPPPRAQASPSGFDGLLRQERERLMSRVSAIDLLLEGSAQ